MQLLANARQLRSNILLKNCFTLQPDKKKIGEKMRKRRSISMDGTGSRRVGAKSSDKDAFFTL